MSYSEYHNMHKVESITHLTETTFVVRFERKALDFIPGQHLVLGRKGDSEFRQYSIYSGVNDPFFEILVKEVENGQVTPKLRKLKVGDELEINGPMGYFTLNSAQQNNTPVVFIATGTGIAPFHSMVASYPKLQYQLLHGVRTIDEAYHQNNYPKGNLIICTSRDKKGHFTGRVTEYLKTKTFKPDTHFYLCGNSEMIFDAMEWLKDQGVSANKMYAEVYF